MTKKLLYTWFTPFLFFFMMLLDSHLSASLFALNKGTFSMNAHGLILALLLYLPHGTKWQNVIYAFLIGVISDIYFLGILGISSFGLPLLAFFFWHLFDWIEENGFTVLLSYILAVILLETVSYGLQVAFQLINGNLMRFVTGLLGPTILLNLVLFLILLFPLKWLYPMRPEEVVNLRQNEKRL